MFQLRSSGRLHQSARDVTPQTSYWNSACKECRSLKQKRVWIHTGSGEPHACGPCSQKHTKQLPTMCIRCPPLLVQVRSHVWGGWGGRARTLVLMWNVRIGPRSNPTRASQTGLDKVYGLCTLLCSSWITDADGGCSPIQTKDGAVAAGIPQVSVDTLLGGRNPFLTLVYTLANTCECCWKHVPTQTLQTGAFLWPACQVVLACHVISLDTEEGEGAGLFVSC